MSSWNSVWLYWDMLIKIYMYTDYLSARARWLISQQQRRKRKRQKSDLSILHKGSCDHHLRHSAEETGCDIRHFPFVQMHSFHQIKLRWSCTLYNKDCCVGLQTLACLSLLTVKLQLKAFSVVEKIFKKGPVSALLHITQWGEILTASSASHSDWHARCGTALRWRSSLSKAVHSRSANKITGQGHLHWNTSATAA